jgi:hypothetical protein
VNVRYPGGATFLFAHAKEYACASTAIFKAAISTAPTGLLVAINPTTGGDYPGSPPRQMTSVWRDRGNTRMQTQEALTKNSEVMSLAVLILE